MDELERLGPIGFQDFVAALCTDIFGPVILPLGAGPDGGRDLYARGDLAAHDQHVLWTGYTVFQAKHRATIASKPGTNANWLWAEIRTELIAWSEVRGQRTETPDTLVFVTNVPLSPAPGNGGHDSVRAKIDALRTGASSDLFDAAGGDTEELAARKQRLARINVVIWDRVHLAAQIASRQGLRLAFRAFITPGDILSNLASWTDRVALEDLAEALRTHARAALVGDESKIYFDEAGSDDSRGFPIHEVAIDLPVLDSKSIQRSALGYIFDRAEHILRPDQPLVLKPRHLVLTGAPGNGKSTLAKFIVQSFRAAMLEGATDLSQEQADAITGISASLQKLGRGLPGHRRWPILLDLAQYVERGGLERESTLTRALAEAVSRRLNAGTLQASDLDSWLSQWPSIVVLDGLDEVSEPRTRRELLAQIETFVSEAEARHQDTLVVLTTRPTGYNHDVQPSQFERIDLDFLSARQGLEYGTMVSRIRLASAPDRLDQLLRRFRTAAQEPSLQNLLRTPLQVLMVTIIIQASHQLAPDRYGLFWGYYRAVLGRERGKSGPDGTLLRDYETQVTTLHERVGLLLQRQSERSQHAHAALSLQEFQDVAWQVLEDDGFHPDSGDAQLLQRILSAAVQRLVLIVPRDAGVGFDVRSLQELLAARRVTTGPFDLVEARLRRIAPSPHWRNTWVFAAGRIMAEPRAHEQLALITLIETLDEDAAWRLGRLAPVGPSIALDMLDDGMVRSRPKWRDRVLAVALRLFGPGIDSHRTGIARPLLRIADEDPNLIEAIASAVRDSLQAGGPDARLAAAFVELVRPVSQSLGLGLRVLALSGIPTVQAPDPDEIVISKNWSQFDDAVETAPLKAEQKAVMRAVAAEVQRSPHSMFLKPDLLGGLTLLLHDSSSARSVEDAFEQIGDDERFRLLLWGQIAPSLQAISIAEAPELAGL